MPVRGIRSPRCPVIPDNFEPRVAAGFFFWRRRHQDGHRSRPALNEADPDKTESQKFE
jgi:hypothetical protein